MDHSGNGRMSHGGMDHHKMMCNMNVSYMLGH